MAGDWIKFETATLDKGEVSLLAKILKIDPDLAIGKLVRFWAWADKITSDGKGIKVTSLFLDRVVYQSGFTAAMLEVGWLKTGGEEDVYEIPNFERQNGHTSKNRLDTCRRVAKSRAKPQQEEEDVTDSRYTCNTDVTKSRYNPVTPVTSEKRREEKRSVVATTVAPTSVPLAKSFPAEIQDAWQEWQDYRTARASAKGRAKLPWTEQAQRLSKSQVEIYYHSHGSRIVADRITAAIAGNWQGLNFDKLESQPMLPNNPQPIQKSFAQIDEERKKADRHGPEKIERKIYDWKATATDEELKSWGVER